MYGLQIWPVHSKDPSEQNPIKILEKRKRGRIQGLSIFGGVPLLSQERVKLRTSNLASTFIGPSEHKPIKYFGEKGAWAYRGTAHILWVPPIIPGTGKATDFKLDQYILRVHPNKSPLKILEKRECGRIEGLPKFFWVPPIISGTGKATDFKLGQYILRVHPNKNPLKFLEKRERGRIQGLPIFSSTPYYLRNGKIWPVRSEGPSEQKPIKNYGEKGVWAYLGLPNFGGYPLLSQELVKLRTSNFARTFIGSIGTKTH